MANTRPNEEWSLPIGGVHEFTWQHAEIAVLMDIRRLLREIRDNTAPLACYRTRRIPELLTKIASNTDRFKCAVHPRYRAILPPKRDCKDCRRMFRRRHA
jgi:hypothetical protein